MHRAVVPVAAAVLLLAGCGSGSSGGSALPTVGASSGTTTASAAQTPTQAPTSEALGGDVEAQISALPEDPEGVHNGTVLDRTKVTKVDEAVLTAWFDYWSARTDMLHKVKIDEAALKATSTGSAMQEVRDYIAFLKKEDAHVMGYLQLRPQSTKITGSVATIEDCFFDTSVNADAKNKPLEQAALDIGTRGTLRKVDGTWVVAALVRDRKVCG